MNINILFQVRLSLIVIPDLIREPDESILYSSTLPPTTGSRIKSGMTISKSLTWKRVYSLLIFLHLIHVKPISF